MKLYVYLKITNQRHEQIADVCEVSDIGDYWRVVCNNGDVFAFAKKYYKISIFGYS